MTNDQLIALRSRIASEPAGPWLDMLVAQFALGWRWICDPYSGKSYFRSIDKFTYGAIRSIHGGPVHYLHNLPPSSSDHNACFAALAELEKRPSRIMFETGRSGFGSENTVFFFSLIEKKEPWRDWYTKDPDRLPLAAARAIALCALDHGLEIEHE